MESPGPTPPAISLDDIQTAAARIAPWVVRTPLLAMTPSGLRLKAENLQPTGAFKLRGAFNTMLLLSEAQRARGVITHSSGNHAMAVAYAAARLGIRAVIVMPSDAPASKREGVRQSGAEIVTVGPASEERMETAARLARAHGYAPIEPYDALEIVTATATIALEILTDLPDVETVFAPVSGGGLIGGLALGLKLARPGVRVVGVEPEVAADALASRQAGRIVALSADQMARTMADGLRVQQLGALNWALVQAHVDDLITVTEAEIGAAMRAVAREARLLAEPSGAVAPAAALRSPGGDPERTVAILSGGNVDAALIARIFREA